MANKEFNTPSEMESYFNNILEKVIDKVSNNLLEHMHEILDDFMYDNGHTDATYEHFYRNGGFWSGWTIDKTKDYVRTLLFDPSKLALPGDAQGTHAGNWSEHDVRAFMPEILDKESTDIKHSRYPTDNPQGSNYRDANAGMSYWDLFQMQLNQKICEWFDDELNEYGIKRG